MDDMIMLFDYAEDEIKDSRKYAEAALKYKDSNPDLAAMFNRLSGEELEHFNMFHQKLAESVAEVKKMRASFEG
jgi:rubrerythrin